MADHPNTDLGRLDIHDAVNAILVHEDSEAAPSEDKVTEEVSAEEAAVTEPQSDSTNIDTGETEPEPEPEEQPEPEEGEESEEEEPEEEGGEEEEAEEPEQEEEEEPEVVMYTTPEGEEVTLDELKQGYLRQSDYTKKTQTLAEAKGQLQAGAQKIQQERHTLAENLAIALNVVEPQLAELAQTDWNKLASEDAYEYTEKRALYDQAQARYNQIAQASQQVIQQQQAQTKANYQAKLQAEQKALIMAMPDMGDPSKARQLRTQLKEYAISNIGLSEKEAANIIDHRMVMMMNKARMYDELNESSLSVAKKKVSKTPKKVVRAGQQKSKAEQNQTARKAQQAKLKKSGSVDDAVALLLGNM